VHADVQLHLVINIIIGCIVFVTVAARLAARHWLGAGIGLDDILIVASLVSTTGVPVRRLDD
jgi:hypothetical protein